jgi:hypothetical protein
MSGVVHESLCISAMADEGCPPSSCRRRCALELIDHLLSIPGSQGISGEAMDLLLDLRHHVRCRGDAEAALRLFCELRRKLEARHYLTFYRLRRWFEANLVARVRICPAAAPLELGVRLSFYCPIAIRRASLCAAIRAGMPLVAPRLEFGFRALAPEVRAGGPVQAASERPSVSAEALAR